MAYALTDTTFLTLDYRYLILDKLDLSGGTLEPRLHKASIRQSSAASWFLRSVAAAFRLVDPPAHSSC